MCICRLNNIQHCRDVLLNVPLLRLHHLVIANPSYPISINQMGGKIE